MYAPHGKGWIEISPCITNGQPYVVEVFPPGEWKVGYPTIWGNTVSNVPPIHGICITKQIDFELFPDAETPPKTLWQQFAAWCLK